jgi:cyclopropane-fatty-acyl-phospholipid synthase
VLESIEEVHPMREPSSAAFKSLERPLAAWAARRFLAALPHAPLAIELPGIRVGPERGALATLRLAEPRALFELCLDPELAFGDLYSEGRLEIEGDLVPLLEASFRGRLAVGLRDRLPRWLRERTLHQELGRAATNARRHYDVGNEFYSLWLDERMVYTCAYFPTPEATLEDAQLAKLDHVCRKVGLRPGMEVIELGSGWGALALHMARRYGVRVRAWNVSVEQVAYAREQAEKQQLTERVEFVLDDWRNASGRCDALVSVGMLEHVGPAHYAELGALAARLLAPKGLALVHTIGRAAPQRLNRWIAERVFPNAHPPALSEMMRIIEPSGFAALDVENLRRHYALTASHWLARYEANLRRIEELVGRATARAWRLYLAGTVASFRTASLHLYQLVFTRAENDAIPWTRADWYAGA